MRMRDTLCGCSVVLSCWKKVVRMNREYESDGDSDSGDDSGRIDIADGLSSDTLNALLAFMNPASIEIDGGDVDNTLDALPTPPSDNSGKISDKSVVAAFTPKDVNVIAETFARLQARADAEELANPKVSCMHIPLIEVVALIFS